jgi:hypothetical protein
MQRPIKERVSELRQEITEISVAFALTSQAQVTVSANLTDGTGATYRTAYLHFQLLNCGDNFPAVPSQPAPTDMGTCENGLTQQTY